MTIIDKTKTYVKDKLEGAEAGHDWHHIDRVWRLTKFICTQEPNVDKEIAELGALLHDIADSKFHGGDEEIGPALARSFLVQCEYDIAKVEKVIDIIKGISFKGGFNKVLSRSLELDIVQDADRLDAIGAIGIARTFNFGGYKNNRMYDPEIKPAMHLNAEEYKLRKGTTINHFYEKLFILKDKMNTKTGKDLAEQRHAFMLEFVDQFKSEWHFLE